MTPKDRLRRAMEAATNMTVASEVWAKYRKVLPGISKDLLISNLNGNRPISKRAAAVYGAAFRVSAGWLLYGEEISETEAGQGVGEVMALIDRLSQEAQYDLLQSLVEKLRLAAPAVSGRARRPTRSSKAT